MAKDIRPFTELRELSSSEEISLTEDRADAWKWFRDKVKDLYRGKTVKLQNIEPDLIDSGPKTRKAGRMYMFRYFPQGKQDLPYYDQFPLVLTTGYTKKYMTGINLHYLPPRKRLELFNRLLDITNNVKFDSTTRVKMSYEILSKFKRFRFFRPCYKRYLRKRIRSKILFIPPDDWLTAINLPTESFVKTTKKRVWLDSINKVEKEKR